MRWCLLASLLSSFIVVATAAPPVIAVDTPMAAPRWARLEREILAANVPACREFFRKYYDDRGYLQAFLRWGANDGPDDDRKTGRARLHGEACARRGSYADAHDAAIRQ